MMLKKITRIIIVYMIIANLLYGWSYDDTTNDYEDYYEQNAPEVRSYLFNTKNHDDFFDDGNFKEIIRFDMIVFVDNEVDDDSKEILYDAIQTIKSYQNSPDEIRVSIIGHTSAITEDENEKCVESGTYAKAICNLFTSCLTKADARKKSKEYASYIERIMHRSGIAKQNTIVDYQSGKDLAYSDNTDKGRDLSNRVMITLYVKERKRRKKRNTIRSNEMYDYDIPEVYIDDQFDEANTFYEEDNNLYQEDENEYLFSEGITTILPVYFQTGSKRIEYDSYPQILELSHYMKDHPEYNIDIIGHTDSVGRARDNFILSQERAKAIKEALIIEGIASQRIKAYGRGESDPIQSNKTQAGRDANRRIEIKIYRAY